MPRQCLMSWEGHPQYRWTKMYKGKKFRITCEELGLTEKQFTKDDSMELANTWWTEKLDSIQSAKEQSHPFADELKMLERRMQYLKRHAMPTHEALRIDREIQHIKTTDPSEKTGISLVAQKRMKNAALLGIHVEPNADPTAIEAIFGDERLWADRHEREKNTTAEKTIGANVTKWIADRMDEATNGVRSPDGADNLRMALEYFRSFCGDGMPVNSVNFELWHKWYVHCAGMLARRDKNPNDGWSAEFAKRVYSTAKSFLRTLWENEILTTLPRNLDSKKYRFERADKEIVTYTNEEITAMMDKASDTHKLLMLLMLNCGMTQKDIADLRRDQIDFEAGTITRRRSKMLRNNKAPKVTYKLWQSTLEQLKQECQSSGELALLTIGGKPWVWKRIENGKLEKSDNVATVFRHLRARVTDSVDLSKKTVKHFRKTSATRLRNSDAHNRVYVYFLGHSDRSIADRHYAGISQSSLDSAIDWLGKELGIS